MLWKSRMPGPLPRSPCLSPHLNFLPGAPPPHLAVYYCNFMTSNMLHSREAPLTHLVGPYGPRCQGEPLCLLLIIASLPHTGERVLARLQRPRWRRGWGFAVSLCRTWSGDHVLLGTLPRNGGRDQTPVQATAAVSHQSAHLPPEARLQVRGPPGP